MKRRRKKNGKQLLAVLLTIAMAVTLLTSIPAKNMSEVQAAYNLSNPSKDSSGVVTWDCVWFGNYAQTDATGKTKDPIKWRVLSVDGNDAFLVADKNLDVYKYNDKFEDVTWKTCILRSWLNGYTLESNASRLDYRYDNFIDRAFTALEKKAILTTIVVNSPNPKYETGGDDNTEDKIFLLSYDEVTNPAYGFSSVDTQDPARVRINTAYVGAGGSDSSSNKYQGGASGPWWLRSPGRYLNNALYVGGEGVVYGDTGYYVDTGYFSVCPALHLDLSASSFWSYAGTVSSNGDSTEGENPPTGGDTGENPGETTPTEEPKPPKEDESEKNTEEGGGETSGETTPTEEPKPPKEDGDEENTEEGGGETSGETTPTEEPKPPKEDENGENTEEGDDETEGEDSEKDDNETEGRILSNPRTDSNGIVTWDCVWFGNYPQSDATGKEKDPIKWRVLSVDGNDAFLVADRNLDAWAYHDKWVEVTWETCTMRSWLNGYAGSSNASNMDYRWDNFIDRAFTASEKEAILITMVVNPANPQYGTDGGNNTEDKVFLLSYDEVTNPSYGFSSADTDDPAKVRTNTAYVGAGGTSSSKNTKPEGQNGRWWLRSPSRYLTSALYVGATGYVFRGTGESVDTPKVSVCPALHLDLSVSSLWSYAGTVSSNGESTEGEDPPARDNTGTEETNPPKDENGETDSSKDGDGETNPSKDGNGETNPSKDGNGETNPPKDGNGETNPPKDGNGGSNPPKEGDNGTAQTPAGDNPGASDVKAVSIKLKGISKKIAAGKKITLIPVFTPENVSNKTLQWTSSNTKYATVNSKGVVTTKKQGAGKSVTITATAQDGSNVAAMYKINIVKHAVKSIKLTAKSKTVKAGKKLTLKATIKTTGKTANKTLQWTSSNEAYAAVTKKGVVKTKKAGKGKTVKITAMATDGTGKKKTLKIKIK